MNWRHIINSTWPSLVILLAAVCLSCSSVTSANQDSKAQNLAIDNQSIEVQNKRPQDEINFDGHERALYIYYDLNFQVDDFVPIPTRIAIFYDNGDFGSMWAQLESDGKSKRVIHAYFDDPVLYGTWTFVGENMKVRLEKCRCTHCGEDDDELKKKDLVNPLPVIEKWTFLEGGTFDVTSVLLNKKKRFRLVKLNDFGFDNYAEALKEPLVVKEYQGNDGCLTYNLKDF